MKRIFSWSYWSIGTKILLLFLGLSVLSMGVLGTVAIVNLRNLGKYALDTSTTLGESAIQKSTLHLNKLGENMVNQKAADVAKQIEMYLRDQPRMTYQEMRSDEELRRIVVQSVGISGYTTLIDPVEKVIIIHKFPEQEKNLGSLSEMIPSFWKLLDSSVGTKQTSGYYDWIEVDSSISQKYASIAFIDHPEMPNLTLWATTYINEFSLPAAETKGEINEAIAKSREYINSSVIGLRDLFLIIFTVLVIMVISIALLLSKVITSPIRALEYGAEELSRGNLNYKIRVKSKDELGELADSFNDMSAALSRESEKVKKTADENIEKERRIQDNLRLYVQKISEAQESERKRIARELHDQTLQDLVVVTRQLDDLSSGNSSLSAQDIRLEVQKILQGVRNFGQELRPSILDDLGLVPAVKWLASLHNKENVISVETVFTGSHEQLTPETDLMLFRIIQEALNNARKHSKSTKVLVRMDFSDHAVNILIRDDGIGFTMPSKTTELTRSGKLGLVGMMERVQLMGGSIVIDSRPGDGATIRIAVPLVYT
jgi:two-component system, NarL family, sensor histidine kinase DegS